MSKTLWYVQPPKSWTSRPVYFCKNRHGEVIMAIPNPAAFDSSVTQFTASEASIHSLNTNVFRFTLVTPESTEAAMNAVCKEVEQDE